VGTANGSRTQDSSLLLHAKPPWLQVTFKQEQQPLRNSNAVSRHMQAVHIHLYSLHVSLQLLLLLPPLSIMLSMLHGVCCGGCLQVPGAW
jgi:hypothetical protein